MSSKDKDKKKEKEDKKKEKEEKRKSDKKDKKEKVDKDKKDKKDKDKDKEKEDEEEQDVFSADFDKNLFPFQRMKHFSAPNQMEAKVRMKSGTGGGTLRERYAVMHCNFIIYYEVTKAGVPLESSRPIGAHKLEDMKAEEVKKYDKEIISGGLIPKMRYYEFAFSVPIGDKIYVIDLPSEEDLKSWLKNLPKQIKNCIEFRSKTATLNPISLVEDLAGRFPMANNIPHGPIKDDEERWVELMRSFFAARNDHFKNLRRAQLYAEYYNPGNRAYIDWFVTSGGEAGKASLEKDILDAEDKYVVGWKKDGTSGFEELQKQVHDAATEEAAREAHAAVSQKIRYINLFKKYQKDLYNRETELFPTELGQLNSMLTAAQAKIDKFEKQKAADADKRRKDAETEHKKKMEDARRAEEERRNDPFSDLNKDQGDPFADLKVEGV